MIRWLVLSALAVNLMAFFWFARQDEVLSDQAVSTDLWQRGLAGEIVLLTELEDIPPTRSPPVVEGRLVEGPQSEDVDVRAVVSIQPLTVPGSVDLEVDDSRPELAASQKVGESDKLLSSVSVKEALREQKLEPESLSEPEPELQCVTLGRFDKEQDANDLSTKLQDTVAVASTVNTVVEGMVRYLVYMPPFDARAMAKEKQAELREAGIRSSLYYKGDLKNGLSLGYFGSRRNAERRYKDLLAADYRVELKVFETKVNRYWIELQGRDDSRLSQRFWQDIAREFPNVIREEVKCSVIN